ncbi:MAG: hypothetical protein R3194_05205, partial [Limnobacter sp.]|nr:hypothetical protein [Limnobacter sp.]
AETLVLQNAGEQAVPRCPFCRNDIDKGQVIRDLSQVRLPQLGQSTRLAPMIENQPGEREIFLRSIGISQNNAAQAREGAVPAANGNAAMNARRNDQADNQIAALLDFMRRQPGAQF